MSLSPKARTIAHVKKVGGYAGDVERWSFRSDQKKCECGRVLEVLSPNYRHDLFGFIDVIAVLDGIIYGIQATVDGHGFRSRLSKACGPEIEGFLRAGGRLEIWAWAKRNNRWAARRLGVTLGTINAQRGSGRIPAAPAPEEERVRF